MNKKTLEKAKELESRIKEYEKCLNSLIGNYELKIERRFKGGYCDDYWELIYKIDDDLRNLLTTLFKSRKEMLEKEFEEL